MRRKRTKNNVNVEFGFLSVVIISWCRVFLMSRSRFRSGDRIGRVKFSEGRGVCEVRTYPSTIQYDYSKYVTSSVSLIDSSLSTQISSTLDVNMGVYGLGKILQRISLECVISYNSGSKLCVNEVIPYLDKLFKEIFLPKTSYFMYDTSIGGENVLPPSV